MNRKYKVHFLGCKANQSDAYSYAGILQRAGWNEASETDVASLILVQSCTVTMSADAQGRQMVRKLKRENPHSKILMTGCYAQRAEQELTQLSEVDYVIGNLNPRKFDLLNTIAGSPVAEDYPDFPMPAQSPRTRVYLKIQDGCDARCSYCIIPAVRGKSRSLPVDEVRRRVEYYRDLGYKEIIFTGISMGGYGKDLAPRSSMSKLMRRVEAIPGDFKIRLSSLEPEEVDTEFIDVFTSSPRFQPHLHLPLQSASDKVLKKMRRQYLFHHYESIVNRLFARMPQLNLGTDILVGFPEEDSEAYMETYRYFDDGPFAYAHVFPFSPRPDTPAAHYSADAPNQEVTQRAARLRALAREKNIKYRKRFLGQKLNGLMLHGTSEGLTDNYIKVQLPGESLHANLVSIRINRVEAESTFGTIVSRPSRPQ